MYSTTYGLRVEKTQASTQWPVLHSALACLSIFLPNLKLRVRISECCSIKRACSLAALSFSHARVSSPGPFPLWGGAEDAGAPPPPPPAGKAPAVLTRFLILMACSVQIPILSITMGLWSASVGWRRRGRGGGTFSVVVIIVISGGGAAAGNTPAAKTEE